MDTLIGITEDRLSHIIATATRQGYEAGCRHCKEQDEKEKWLNSRTEIIRFLSPDKNKPPMSVETFRRNRRKGMYGNAIMGQGINCRCRKDELMDAIHKYHMNIIQL